MSTHEQPAHTPRSSVRVSVVIPLYNGVDLTRECIASLADAGWDERDELVLVDNASSDGTAALLDELEGTATIIRNARNRNFAGACNQGVEAARGEWVVLLNNDTEVVAGWIDTMLAEATAHDADVVGARLLYPDGRVQHGGICVEPGVFPRHLRRYEPATSPRSRASFDCQAVTGACMLVRRELYLASGGMDEAFRNGCEDLDFCLRVRADHGARIRYCGTADVIHHESVSLGRNDHDDANAELLFERWGDRMLGDRVAAEKIVELACPTLPWRRPTPRTSIIVPLHNRLDMTRACVESLIECGLDDAEVVLVDNASTDGTAEWCEEICGEIRVLRSEHNINFAGACNLGMSHSLGTNVVFLNNDTVVTPGWLDALVAPLDDPRIGIVGARLLYPDGTIQHAGVAFGPDLVGFHVNAGAAGDDPAVTEGRMMQAVTGACLAIRRETFLRTRFDLAYRNGCEDLELCLRMQEFGLGVWYEPSCVVYHHESQTAGRFDHAGANLQLFLSRWRNVIIPDVETFDRADIVAPVHPYPFQPGPWTRREAIPGFASGVPGTVQLVALEDASDAVARANAALATTDAEWIVLVPPGAGSATIERARAARVEPDPLTGRPARAAVVLGDGCDEPVLAVSLAAIDLVGGLNHDLRAAGTLVRDLMLRLALSGVPTLQVDVRSVQREVERDEDGRPVWNTPPGDAAVFAAAWNPRPTRPAPRTARLYEPLVATSGTASDADFATRSRVVFVAGDDPAWPGFAAAIRAALDSVHQRDDVTVVVRAADVDAAAAVLEEAAAGIADDDLADLVLVPGDARLDGVLCDLADTVVVDAVPGIRLHGLALAHDARPLCAAGLAAALAGSGATREAA